MKDICTIGLQSSQFSTWSMNIFARQMKEMNWLLFLTIPRSLQNGSRRIRIRLTEAEPEVPYALEEEYMTSFLNQIKNGVLE